MFLDGLLNARIHGKKRLFCTPVEFLDVMATKRINHCRDTWCLTTAAIIEVEHALDSARLKTIYKRSGSPIEWAVPRTACCRMSVKVNNLIIGLCALARRLDLPDVNIYLCRGDG